MKFTATLYVAGGSHLSGQDSCGLYIRTDFDSECLLATLAANGILTHVDECLVEFREAGNDLKF